MKKIDSFAKTYSNLTFLQEKEGGAVGFSSKEESQSNADEIYYQLMSYGLVAHNYQDPFFRKREYGRWVNKSSLGSVVMTCLELVEENSNQSELTGNFVYKEENPAVTVIKQALRAVLSEEGVYVDGIGYVHAILDFSLQYELLEGDDFERAKDALNGLMRSLRKHLLSRGMREKVKSFRRNATQRYKQIMNVARQSWKRNNKNLLIRIDWGFLKAHSFGRVMFKTEEEFVSQMKFVDACRKDMLKILRQRFGKDLAMYVWKIECGEYKGIHIHWMLVINASHHQDRINVPYQICKEWDKKIGYGKTYSFNVNAHGDERTNGLGVIEYSDPNLWKVVGVYADYLTKVDYAMKLRMPKGMYSFGCTKIKNHARQKPGPKRKKEMTEMNILQVRGPQGRRRTRGL